jgi:hypothetical protein
MPQSVDDALSISGCAPALTTELTRALKTGNTTTAIILNGCGLPYPTAIALAAQVNTRTGNASQLVNAGFSPPLAAVMAAQITAGPA